MLQALRRHLKQRVTAPGRYIVFYDAACALCRRTRHWLERAGLDAPLQFVDVNDRAAMARWPRIDFHQAQHEVFVIDPAGRLRGGYDAALRLLQGAYPTLRHGDRLLRSFPMRQFGARTYNWVSRHRYQLSRWLPRATSERRPPPRRARSLAMATGKKHHQRRQINPFKGAIAGMLGGLAASWAMEQAQMIAKDLADRQRAARATSGDGQAQQNRPPEQRTTEQLSQEQQQQQEPATVKAAQAVTERYFDHELTEQEKPLAGEAMHYGFGAAMGALYGILAELTPAITHRGGLTYGISVWAIADEIGVPAAGLAEPPHKQPMRSHAYALGSHLVFGLSLEIVRRFTRWLLR